MKTAPALIQPSGDPQPRARPRLPVIVLGCLALLVLMCASPGVLFPAFAFTLRGLVQNFRVEGRTMSPAIQSGDYLLVSLKSYWLTDPRRGDIVVFKAWDSDKDFIKRVIGIPGDVIEIKKGGILIDGVALEEPYVDQATADELGPITLREDEYYVLGDNRGASNDSRHYGPLPRERIVGKAWIIYSPEERRGFVHHHRFDREFRGN